jgi:Sigma-70, region 4
MVSDRNRQIIERRHSGESFSAIGTALGLSRERVRQIVEREERREQRAQELEEPPASPSSQIRFSCRRGCATCWPSCSERPTLRPTT